MKKNYLFFLLLISSAVIAQQKRLKKTDDAFENLAYMDVVKIYEKAVLKGYGTTEIYLKLGDAYYFNAAYPDANKWYEKALETATSDNPEYYYRYAQSLKSVGESQKADEYLKKFSEMKKGDTRGIKFMEQPCSANTTFKKHNEYLLQDAGINTEYSEFSTVFRGENLVFTSSRKNQNQTTQEHQWTKQPFTDLFSAEVNSEQQLGNIKNFDAHVNSKFNESTAVFTKDGTTVYFTRNNFDSRKKDRKGVKSMLLKIYKATFRMGRWEDITELPFNSANFNSAHPALSNDEKKLYFASDRPGTIGQSDIYVVTIQDDGTYGAPVNLGKTVNTEGRESFPYVAQNGDFYFASDGHLGLGGLDLFKVEKNAIDDTYSDAENLPPPFNSTHDDFAYMEAPSGNYGFISSNRPGGKGYDDIYKFTKKREQPTSENEQQISGQVTDRETGNGISQAIITLFNKNYEKIKSVSTDVQGNYQWDITLFDKEFFIRTEAQNYHTQEHYISTDKDTKNTIHNISLNKEFYDFETGKDLAKAFEIEDIYFDLDKWEITLKSEKKLGLLLVILQEFPSISLEIRSHTDSRASETYNLSLSEKRAKATLEWLVKNGISNKRLRCKGLGETQLLNKCKNGTECSEEEHRINRRTEFIITAK